MNTPSPAPSPGSVSRSARKPSRSFTPGSKGWLPVFLLPICIGLALVYVAATIGIGLGFTNWNLISPAQFSGLDNFTFAMQDPRFWQAWGNTVKLVMLTVPAKIVIGLLLAVLMSKVVRFVTFFRMALFFPTTCHVVSVAFIWKSLYGVDGLLNHVLQIFGFQPIHWMAPERALSSIAVMIVWGGVGYTALLYVAGLQTIPSEYYDAAQIDGASSWQRFRYITLPLLAPTTFFVLVTSLIAAFQTFGEVYVLKGPLDSTLTIMGYIYERAFAGLQMGYSAAISAVLIAVLLVVTAVQMRVQRRWVTYDV